MYPGLVVFVLLFTALLFDTFTVVHQQRIWRDHAETVGRLALTRFDQPTYRQTGSIVLLPEIAQAVAQTDLLRPDVACHVDTGVGEVTVTCAGESPPQLLRRSSGAAQPVTVRLRATLVCTGCTPS
jgi:hypothetical protein